MTEQLKASIAEGKRMRLSAKEVKLNILNEFEKIWDNQIMDATEKESSLNTLEECKEVIKNEE